MERVAQLLERMFDFAPVGLQIYKADGHCLYVNHAFLDLFGSAPPPDYNVLVDEIAEAAGILDKIRRAFAGETIAVPPIWYDPRDLKQVTVTEGRRVAVSAVFFPLFDEAGAVTHVGIVFRDETEMVCARERAEEDERRLRTVTDALPTPIALLDRDQRYRVVNRAYLEWWHRSLDTIVGRTPREAHGEQLWKQVEAHWTRAFAGEVVTFEDTIDYPTGTRWVRVTLVPQPADHGVDGVVMLATDLTDEHMQQKWLEAVLDLSPVPMVMLDPETARARFANAAADRMAGGRFPLDEVTETHRRAARGDELTGHEMEWALPSGKRTLLASARTLPPMYDRPATVVMTFEDVSRLKQTESELQRAVEMRDTFLSIASHELKTPLTALQLQAHRLLRGLHASDGAPSPSLVGATAEKMTEQTRRLARLIDEMLDVSRITAGRMVMRRETVDLSALVAEVADRFSDEAARAGSPIRLEADPFVVGSWDRARLDQVISNLVGNAVKYGAGQPVTVELRGDASAARLTVRDGGIGIAVEDQRRIFERFERAASERRYGGLGLGLWIARRIVEALGGTISVDSAPGRGAAFTVTLPRDG